MADKQITDFIVLENAQDNDLLLVASEGVTYAIKVKTLKDAVEGAANRAEAAVVDMRESLAGFRADAEAAVGSAEAAIQAANTALGSADLATDSATAAAGAANTAAQQATIAAGTANEAIVAANEVRDWLQSHQAQILAQIGMIVHCQPSSAAIPASLENNHILLTYEV